MNLMARYKKMDENSKSVLCNTVCALLIKGGALLISLLTTPAFIRYFADQAVLGVWYTLLSMLMWFLNFDLGIGNGLRNQLVQDFAKQDHEAAGKTLSSGLFANGIVTIVLTIVGVSLIQCLDWNRVFNIAQTAASGRTLKLSAMIVFLGIMLRFFLSAVSAVLYALQLSSVNNLLALCVSVLQLIFVWMVKPQNSEQGLLLLAAAYAVLSNLPVCVAGVALFSTKLKHCRPTIKSIEKSGIRSVMGIGTAFFVCQIAYMLLVNTNEFLISLFFGPQDTTQYTFYYKLTSLIAMIASLALTPIWSAVTKAMAERNYHWVSDLYQKLKLGGMLAGAVQFAFVPMQQFVMDLWLGADSIAIDYGAAAAFACFGSVFTYCSVLSTMVCGMGRMRLQMICYSVGAVLKLLLVYVLVAAGKNWTAVVWSNAIVLLPYCILQQLDLNRYLKILGKHL